MSDTPRTDKQIAFIKDQIKNDSASLCADHPYYVLDVMAALCRELEAEVVRKDAALLESQQMMLDEQEKRQAAEEEVARLQEGHGPIFAWLTGEMNKVKPLESKVEELEAKLQAVAELSKIWYDRPAEAGYKFADELEALLKEQSDE